MTEPIHRLIAAELAEEIFQEQILPTLAGPRPVAEPVAILLTGQAGAGKTKVAGTLADRFAGVGGSMQLDVDQFKLFHPDYQALIGPGGLVDDAPVQEQARSWLARAVDHCATNRLNVVVEHGLRDRAVTDDVIGRLAATHRVEGAVVATPLAASGLAVLNRYQAAREQTGHGRDVPSSQQYERFSHLKTAAGWLADDARVATVGLYRRSGEQVPYATGTSVLEALRTERERPWTWVESEEFLRYHDSLVARMAPEWQPRLAAARELATPYLDPEAGQPPSTDRSAVTYGRYQIVSIAHLDTIRTMLRDWPAVTVGVIDSEAGPLRPGAVDPALEQFYATAEANLAAERNPMPVSDRVRLWEHAIEAASMSGRVTAVAIPPPEGQPTGFNERFPPDRYDLVFPAASDAELPLDQRGAIFGRVVSTVEPPLEFHTSTIRQSYREGTDLWQKALAPGTEPHFTAIDGPAKVLGLDASVDRKRATTVAKGLPTGERAGPVNQPPARPATAPPDRQYRDERGD